MFLRFGIIAAASVVLGFAAGTLAGCQHEAGGMSPAATSGYGLHLVDDGEHVKLAYGQANSDNVGLMLECAKGSQRIEVSDLQRRGDDRVIRLASGERRSALRAEVQDFEGARLLLAATRTDDPAVAGFHRTGQLKVASGGVTYAISARGAEQAAVDRFFSACNRA